MKRFLLFGLMGLMLVACFKDNEDDIGCLPLTKSHHNYRYEGIWSIDDEPIEQTFTVCYSVSTGDGCLKFVWFPTFPYQAFADRILTDIKVHEIVKQNKPFQIRVSMVGNSIYEGYYNAESTNTKMLECYGTYLSYDVLTQDEGKVTVTLGLQLNESVFSFSETAASSVLVVQRVELTYEDGSQKTLELSPAKKLTFVSKRDDKE